LDLAIRMLTSTQVYVRPTNIPESGDYTSFPALPAAAAQGEPQVWAATQVDDAEKILFAMQRLVHLRHSNLTVFLSPNAAGHPQHTLFGISRQLSLKEVEGEVENDKQAYAYAQEQARIAQQKREAEERIEQERQAEALRINRVEFENAGYGRQRGQKKTTDAVRHTRTRSFVCGPGIGSSAFIPKRRYSGYCCRYPFRFKPAFITHSNWMHEPEGA